ncbi:DedA family protein [Actinomyces sp. oral taxon 181]|uniref:DedA family protein n=1 Tax=Actinomyces sp. oral taxon 181 TaxID=712121 RepID=UPI0002A2CB0A|nr:DedA family protein [Actinomyces sp. oral taxon 181]EKY15853.1 SNARE-like domain protein [Actinomyces sp. oral taxon 181 str. F0379]
MLNAILVNASGLDTFINWFKDPESLLVAMGPWVLWGTMLIVLIESGVLFPVLPGESLLFTAGLLHDRLGLHLPTLIIMVVVAAFIGAQIGYFLGAKWGRKLFKPDARVLKTEPFEKAEHYFRDYGGRSLVIGRFIPFVRTFIPLAAGIARYPYSKFLLFNTLGALLWGAGFIIVGSLLGNVPFVHDNLTLILGVIILVSVLPVILEIIGQKRNGGAQAKEVTENLASAQEDRSE